jgi:hypothetical protein
MVAIDVDKDTRGELRKYKAEDGQTYTEAIEELLENAGWYDD